MYCFACGYDLQEQVLDRLTIAKHEFKVLLANSKVPVSVVFHTNQDLELQVGDRKCLLVKPRAKYDHQKTAILAPVVTGIFVFEPEIALLECGSDDDALIARLSSLPPFRCSQELVSLFGSGMLDHNIWRKLRLVILLLLANLRHDPIHVMLITDGHNPLLIRFLNMLMALGSTEMKNWNPHFYPRLEPRKIIFHQNSTKNQFMMIPIDLDLIPKRQLDMSKWSHPQFQKITHDTLHFDWHCSLLGITEYSLPEDSRYSIQLS